MLPTAFALLVCGILIGIKILVGTDPLADVEAYGKAALDFDSQPENDSQGGDGLPGSTDSSAPHSDHSVQNETEND